MQGIIPIGLGAENPLILGSTTRARAHNGIKTACRSGKTSAYRQAHPGDPHGPAREGLLEWNWSYHPQFIMRNHQ